MKKYFGICLVFVAALAGCSLTNLADEEKSPIKVLFVGPEMVTCTNPLRNNLCYQVREKMEDAWQLYRGEIMGLQYKPGNIYELMVQADTKSVPSSDSPEVQWVMVQVVSSVPAPAATSVPAELQETMWTLEQFGKPDQLSTAPGESAATIFFQKDGHFTGSSGCNRFNGKYTVDGQTIQFESLAATKKMCTTPDGMLVQEQTMFNIFQQTGHFDLVDQRLSISSPNNDWVLIFHK
jgi:heat shock protein HslJ